VVRVAMNASTRRRSVTGIAVAGVSMGLLLLAVGCAQSVNGDGFDSDLAADLDAMVERWAGEAAAGGVVAWVENPAGHQSLAAGPADADGEVELTGQEAFRIASITKVFTATVALQLAEQGDLDLDAPIAEVVPEPAALLEHGGEITLRQLLGHTAGLPDYRNLDPWAVHAELDNGGVIVDCDDVEPYVLLREDLESLTEPGEDFSYSGNGYFLAGEIIEVATGQRLEDVYRERILEPLEMNDTWLDCVEEPRAELARGLHPPGVDHPDVVSFPLPGPDDELLDVTGLGRHAWASAGLVSTAEDVGVFARALFTGELFDQPDTLEQMLTPGPVPFFGLGVELGDRQGRDTVGHPGQLPGYNSRLAYHREHEVTIVALSNQTPNPHRTALATLLAEQLSDVLRRHDHID
jgi:D-alanyl-D-alanine carboxypeptidase